MVYSYRRRIVLDFDPIKEKNSHWDPFIPSESEGDQGQFSLSLIIDSNVKDPLIRVPSDVTLNDVTIGYIHTKSETSFQDFVNTPIDESHFQAKLHSSGVNRPLRSSHATKFSPIKNGFHTFYIGPIFGGRPILLHVNRVTLKLLNFLKCDETLRFLVEAFQK